MTQALSISSLGSQTFSWRSLSLIPFTDQLRPRVLAGEQQRLPTQDSADFYIPMFKFMLLRWRSWKAWRIRNSNRLMSGWMFSPNKSPVLAKHIWRSEETLSGFSCPPAALSHSVERTWGEGQNVSRPHTQSPHESRGVNPVSNKQGLTLVNPTTSAANTTSQNEISELLTYTRVCS